MGAMLLSIWPDTPHQQHNPTKKETIRMRNKNGITVDGQTFTSFVLLTITIFVGG
uniref:Uncharacterized protein n=1 Tax=Arion vulgaris TaxID=1028688 RepID=A0A0B6YMQ8_9EUPU